VPNKTVNLGPLQVTEEERHNVPLPPILGALACVGGITVLVLDRREK